MNPFTQIILAVILIASLASLLKEGRGFVRKLRVRLRGIATEGTVTGARSEKNGDDTRYYATVRFRTDNMQTIKRNAANTGCASRFPARR